MKQRYIGRRVRARGVIVNLYNQAPGPKWRLHQLTLRRPVVLGMPRFMSHTDAG
jgi:hypothetical protein